MKINHRAYRGEEDDQPIRDFLRACYRATNHPFYSVDPPNWERFRAGARSGAAKQHLFLWQQEEHRPFMLAGLALYQQRRNEYSYLVHPDHPEIADSIIGRVEETHQQASVIKGDNSFLCCSVCDGNEEQQAILARRGYSKGEPGPIFRRRILTGLLSASVLPAAFTLLDGRSISGALLTERAQVENELFNRSLTAGFLQELQRAPIYRPELDMVITGPGGDIAAFCTAWFDQQTGAAFIEPIGTAAAYRQQGFARVLLLEGFRRLQNLEAEIVFLGHSASNKAANELYQSVGLTVFDRENLWYKIF